MATKFSKGIGGSRFAFVNDRKVVDVFADGTVVLVEACVDRMPVARLGTFASVAEALAEARR